jgi:hypothetical protein
MTRGGRKREEIGEGGSAADGTGSPASVGLRRRGRSPSCQGGKGDGTGIRGGGGGGTAGTGRGGPRQTSGRQQGIEAGTRVICSLLISPFVWSNFVVKTMADFFIG